MGRRHTVVCLVAMLAVASCGDDDAAQDGPITLVVYDSWTDALDEVLAGFTDDTGVAVEVLRAGDTGTMVSKAVLTAGNPEGDVMFGVDNTFLSRVLDEEVFEPYEAEGVGAVPQELRALTPDGEATPMDFGDVCINYDEAGMAERDLDPPADLTALADPAYAGLLVVQNPASSSPGLAFMLATIAEFGEDGWTDYWSRLRENGVQVVESWEDAYYGAFSGAGDGDRPLVVSYGTSPPAEVVFADPPIDEPTTGVVDTTCFRQVEYAGVLRGTAHAEAARDLVDFLLSETFQAELPLNLFVYPANADVALPDVFTANATVPADPKTVDPDVIAEQREAWLETWTDTVLR